MGSIATVALPRHLPQGMFAICLFNSSISRFSLVTKRSESHITNALIHTKGKVKILAPAQFDKKCCKQTLPCTNITGMHPMLHVKSTNPVRMSDTNQERNHSSQHQSSNCLDGKIYSSPGKCSGVTNDVRRKEPPISAIWIRSQQESWELQIIGRSALLGINYSRRLSDPQNRNYSLVRSHCQQRVMTPKASRCHSCLP